MNYKKIIALFSVIFVMSTPFAFAAKTSKEKLNEINAEKKKVKAELYETNKKWQEISASLASLDKQIS